MIEYPEVITLAHQLQETVVGKQIKAVLPPTKTHKFCWFNGDVHLYEPQLKDATLTHANGFGLFVEMAFDNGKKLCINDGVNVRFLPSAPYPTDFQLLLRHSDGSALAFAVAMYGGIVLHDGTYDNPYYLKSRTAIAPTSADFPAYFDHLWATSKPTLSAKAFLATEQRFPGIGNGVLQDILFEAGIHPKRKLGTLTEQDKKRLYTTTLDVLHRMTEQGGRNTEKDLFGHPMGYKTQLSKNTLAAPCPRCGHALVKEAYLGGAVYFCPVCQPL